MERSDDDQQQSINLAQATAQDTQVPHYQFVAMIPGSADYAGFSQRVNELLAQGYELYGSPCMTFNGMDHIAGQALVRWSSNLAQDR